MSKPHITRTFGPIHFEDLEPHRFEDLARGLIYDYKNWQTIEPTGKLGKDDGFDIRAYEKSETIEEDFENPEEPLQSQLMAGNLRMIQCKREKKIGPTDISKILEDVDNENPPYGYILIASADFSKKSHDTFREILISKGVMEFYLWGKATLEDMLYLPKNDHLLFAFFGVSFVTKKKSRTSEIRSLVVIKNKLYATLGRGTDLMKSVLIRDVDSKDYPYEKGNETLANNYSKRKEYIVYSHHELGIILNVHKYFAYVDSQKKEWDCSEQIDLLPLRYSTANDEWLTKQKAQDFWDHLPKPKQAYFIKKGLVKYENIVLVDKEGDEGYEFPHIFVDFLPHKGPFGGFNEYIEKNGEMIFHNDYKRVSIFPDTFPEKVLGEVHTDPIIFPDNIYKYLTDFHFEVKALYGTTDKYKSINQKDVISIASAEDSNKKIKIEITNKYTIKVKDYLIQTNNSSVPVDIKGQLGRDFKKGENIVVCEFRQTR